MKKYYGIIAEYFWMTLGAFLIAFAIVSIYNSIGLVTGGVSGLAIVFDRILHVPLAVTNTVINAFLFIAAYKFLGWKYIRRTVYTTAMLSFALYILPKVLPAASMSLFKDDMIISAVFGGICTGVGVGLTVRHGTSTGGTDMLAWLIKLKLKDRSVVEILQVLDGLVVILGIYVFGIKAAMYALINVYIVTKVSDNIVEGVNYSKQIFVISDMAEEIAEAIMKELERGVTSIQAKGMYSKTEKKMLFCVIRRKELGAFKELVAKIDKNAFVTLSDSREVFGEGFIENLN